MDPARGFEEVLPATVRGLRGVRHRFREWVGREVDDDVVLSDLVLALSELCSTAVRSTRNRGRSSPTVHAWLEGAAVVIEIRDAGVSPVERSASDSDEVASSRALSIVAALTDVLTVRNDERDMLWRVRKEGVAGNGGRNFAGVR